MGIKKIEGFERIYSTEDFSKEFKSLFNKSKPIYIRYTKKLAAKLKILDSKDVDNIKLPGFEHIKDDIWSIRFTQSTNNLRVLYVRVPGKDIYVLLIAFLEKNSSDYSLELKRANKKLHEL